MIQDWSPTNEFRWLEKEKGYRVLQQKWISRIGNEKWEDVPIVKDYEINGDDIK